MKKYTIPYFSYPYELSGLGGMMIDSDFYDILSFELDTENLTNIISELNSEFGKSTSENIGSERYLHQLIWENIDISEFKNSKLIISFNNKTCAFRDEKEYFYTMIFFLVTDEKGNDLLKDGENKKKIKVYLETKINNCNL